MQIALLCECGFVTWQGAQGDTVSVNGDNAVLFINFGDAPLPAAYLDAGLYIRSALAER